MCEKHIHLCFFKEQMSHIGHFCYFLIRIYMNVKICCISDCMNLYFFSTNIGAASNSICCHHVINLLDQLHHLCCVFADVVKDVESISTALDDAVKPRLMFTYILLKSMIMYRFASGPNSSCKSSTESFSSLGSTDLDDQQEHMRTWTGLQCISLSFLMKTASHTVEILKITIALKLYFN